MNKNVLFILVDCLRADKCYGANRTAKTPNIDMLIKKGVFFSKMIATTTTTTPSVSSIFTGLYAFAHGVRSLRGYKLASSVKTLAEIFKVNGYNTCAEVTGPLVSNAGLDRGFDRYCYRLQKELFIHKWGDALIAKFKNNEFKEPWFIFIHLWELHEPRYIFDGFNNNKFGKNKYERALSGLDARLGELFRHLNFETTTVIFSADHGEKIPETIFDDKVYEYKNRIGKLSWHIFTGIIRKTYKLFRIGYEKLPDFAKHKPFPNPAIKSLKPARQAGHGSHIYDSAVVIPLIIVGNRDSFPKNRLITNQVRQIDILPTLIEALNLHIDNNFNIHGQSLLPLIKGLHFEELPAYCEACGAVLGVEKYWKVGLRTSKYKFIYRPYHSDKHEELYDLENDPLERKNIIKFQPQIAKALKEQLFKIRREDSEGLKLVGQKMSSQEEKLVSQRLKDLGYI